MPYSIIKITNDLFFEYFIDDEFDYQENSNYGKNVLDN